MNVANLFHRNAVDRAQASRIADATWEGATVVELHGAVGDTPHAE